MQPFKRLAAASAAASFLLATAAAAATVNVTVNGQPMSFDQPPVMQNNRVFVPMRAIFERLGSTVVYQNGVINAHGNGRSVHLVIGSTQATVNGSPLTLDVAPFSVAGRTEVPLRFVAQALGATVNWNPNAATVAIMTQGGNVSYTPEPQTNQSFNLTSETPSRRSTVNTTQPAIHATFSEAVNRDSLRVSVDGHDITSLVYANPNGFDVTPNFQLPPGTHHVAVSGTTAAGAQFNTGWSFTTAGGASPNRINYISPPAGSRVGSNFTLTGHTRPGSHVHIVASAAANIGGLLQVGTGTFQTDVTADGSGNFSAPIALNSVSGGQVRVIVTSSAPDGSAVEQSIVYSS
ncbi:MAG TPA: copper amine oxidase N-terminal domain-containing protein [Candidatus Baltobacteraceae bacterium]|jgi:hypothetical protein|nr:copper amine oxidase N-terminal domain-containing protein [Candidatus Baltobacteraceae bacterium]